MICNHAYDCKAVVCDHRREHPGPSDQCVGPCTRPGGIPTSECVSTAWDKLYKQGGHWEVCETSMRYDCDSLIFDNSDNPVCQHYKYLDDYSAAMMTAVGVYHETIDGRPHVPCRIENCPIHVVPKHKRDGVI